MTVKQINSAIKKFNLEVIKGEGYYYFVDIDSKSQIGPSINVRYLKDLSKQEWLEEADGALREHNEMYNEYV